MVVISTHFLTKTNRLFYELFCEVLPSMARAFSPPYDAFHETVHLHFHNLHFWFYAYFDVSAYRLLSWTTCVSVCRRHNFLMELLFYFICSSFVCGCYKDFLCHQQSRRLHHKNVDFMQDCNSPSTVFDTHKNSSIIQRKKKDIIIQRKKETCGVKY